jgi:phosphate starvation-inducible protein PhoH and related proteins
LKPVEVSFSPVDNQRLANLCGALDENLRQIEAAFDVAIARRGERFALSGAPDQMRLAAEALEKFYARARRNLSVEDVQLGLIEVARVQHEAPAGGAPQLKTRRHDLHGRTPRQVQYLKQIQSHDITFAIGPAGTGKSYLAVAAAVQALQRREVQRIVLTRPAVEAGERLGFLPGDLMAKVDPYLRPLYDALYDMLGPDGTQRLLEKGTVEVAPLAFMRGRTLNGSFIILDEAQNTTPEQMKMFLTRIGFGSRCVVTGDVTQIDLGGATSGLLSVERILEGIEGIAFVRLTRRDVVRHRIVASIVDAYERAEGR